MLTSDRLVWSLGATVGTKFSKRFAMEKTAQKVAYNPNQTVAEPTEEPENTGGGNTGGGDNGNGDDGMS
jgi:hypothetical protein